MHRWIFAALFSAVVGHCTSAFAAEQGAAGTSRPLTLEEAISRALAASPSLQSREAMVTGADAGIRQSGVLPNPSLDLEVENFAGSGPFQGFDEAEMTLTVTHPIERGGKRDARVAVARAQRDIAVVERDRSRLDVALEAQRGFYEASAAAALLDIAEARLASAIQVEAMAARRVRAARDPVTVRLRAEIQTAEARGAQAQAVIALQTAKRHLTALWGESDAPFEVAASALFATTDVPAPAVAANAPDVLAREAAVRKAASALDLEIANASTDVAVGVGLRRFESGGEVAAVLSVSVPIPVYDTNQGNIERAAAERRAAALDVIDAQRSVERERMSLEDEAQRALAEAKSIREALLPRAEEALRAARRGYDAGAFAYLELSESQRTLNELRTREVEALQRFHVARTGLDRLSGRLSAATVDQGQKS